MANNYDLSVNRYKEVKYKEVDYEEPEMIMATIEGLEKAILMNLAELKEMLT
ncbi:MAG: hypothetical protein A4E53_00282 [Pelotomaculum sp. PtaB.Bin104]|nr:MAG: hypothetical protein A4E53_00282 [Pelotomaculum sp. PtaB.Bin104]